MEKKEWVVCINQLGWHYGSNHNDPAPGPKYNDICRVIGHEYIGYLPVIYLAEWDDPYNPEAFRPIDMNLGTEICESIERQPVKQLA